MLLVQTKVKFGKLIEEKTGIGLLEVRKLASLCILMAVTAFLFA